MKREGIDDVGLCWDLANVALGGAERSWGEKTGKTTYKTKCHTDSCKTGTNYRQDPVNTVVYTPTIEEHPNREKECSTHEEGKTESMQCICQYEKVL